MLNTGHGCRLPVLYRSPENNYPRETELSRAYKHHTISNFQPTRTFRPLRPVKSVAPCFKVSCVFLIPPSTLHIEHRLQSRP